MALDSHVAFDETVTHSPGIEPSELRFVGQGLGNRSFGPSGYGSSIAEDATVFLMTLSDTEEIYPSCFRPDALRSRRCHTGAR